MKRPSILLGTLLLAAAGTGLYAVDAAQTSKLQKVVIVVLARDGARAAEVEAGVKAHLVEKGIFADSIMTLMMGNKPASVSELTTLMKSRGYETVLCMGPRRTMRITAEDKASDFPTLEACLSSFLTGKYPSGQTLASTPFSAEAQPTQPSQPASDMSTQRTPIASNPGAAPVTYFKRTMRLFDMSKQTLLWEGKFNVKIPTDLQASLQTKWLAHEAVKALEKSGLLP